MTEKDNDPMGKALGLPALEFEKTIDNMLAKAHDDSARNDFEAARSNLYEVIQSGKEAMDKLGQIAASSQHPRAFEVLSKMMETMIQANKDLLELQTKIREIDVADAPTNEKAKTINNNLFVGSTAELQKMIKDMNTKND
jgi:hypothetical protein